jgi:ubiquinone/menaquinone biosynthesis C-methylase UbiE
VSNDVLTSIAKELFERYPNGASHSVLRSVEMYSLRNLMPKSLSILLDLGCGEGIFFMIFKKKFSITCKNIIGVDIKLGVYNNLICCDARLLPFKDNSIEICMSVSVLEHIPQYQKVLTEVERVLTHCSTFYTTVVNAEVFSSNFVIPKLMAQIPGMKDMQKIYSKT